MGRERAGGWPEQFALRASPGVCSRSRGAVAIAAAFWLAGCHGAGPELAPLEPRAVEPPSTAFSIERAWHHLEVLVALDADRAEAAAEQARAYVRARLDALGAEPSELAVDLPNGAGRAVHVIGELAGRSPDVFLLAAPYLPHDSDACAGGASAAALLLELTRALAVRDRPYTYRVVFLDAPASDDVGASGASSALVAHLAEEERLSEIRAAFFFARVADEGLRIARDLRSHRVYREIFWDSARALALEEHFPSESGYAEPEAGHLAFHEWSFRRVVAIVGERDPLGADASGVAKSGGGRDRKRCAPESLEAVGRVSLEALDRIATRLLKIDRFVESQRAASPGAVELSPDAEPPSEAASPGS